MMRISISSLINGESKAEPAPVQKLPLTKLYGREYFFWNGRVHPFPWDESQRDLLDILHEFTYNCALGQRLHTVQLRIDPHKPLQILDLGYGTGNWTIEMGRTYPSAQITGFDIIPFEINTDADNVRNMSPVDFNRETWPISLDSQDLIHMALLCGNVPDWERMYRTSYKYLRPATGRLEHIELDFTPFSHPHPYPSTSPAVQTWWNVTTTASTRAGYPLNVPTNTRHLLEKAGFVDVSHRKIRIPFAGSPHDAYEQELSEWFRTAMAQDPSEQRGAANSYAGLSGFLLAEQLGWSEGEVRRLCADVVKEVNRRGTVLYCNLHVFTARKPGRPQDSYQTPVSSPQSQPAGTSRSKHVSHI